MKWPDGPLRPALPLAARRDPADGLEAGPAVLVPQPAGIVRDRRDASLDAPAAGCEKGQVENQLRFVRGRWPINFPHITR